VKLPETILWRGLELQRVHRSTPPLWKSSGGILQRPDLGCITARLEKRRSKEKPYEALVCIDGRGYTHGGDTPEEALEWSLALRVGRVELWLRRAKLWVEETKP
jgi:hypothetical protein